MQDDQIDDIFKALAHPERRRILAGLVRRPGASLFEICSQSVAETGMSLSRQTMSQHLDLLERAGLIETEWAGRVKLHRARLEPLRIAVGQALSGYLTQGHKGEN